MNTDLLKGPLTNWFMAYNILMMLVSSVLLILLLAIPDYPPTSQFQAARGGEPAQRGTNGSPPAGSDASANPSAKQVQVAMGGAVAQVGTNVSPPAGSAPAVVSDPGAATQVNRSDNTLSKAGQAGLSLMLFTMLTAGLAGGTLCNLRGIFKYYRDESGLPHRFVVPFVIRPFMGGAAGLLAFFVATFFSGALSGPATDASAFGWTTLAGRLPFVALAIVAGFGSQEFMERMKEVAKTTFADSPKEIKPLTITEVAAWTDKDGPVALAPGADELVLVYGNLTRSSGGPVESEIYYPDKVIPKPKGPATAIKITGRTLDERKAVAEQLRVMKSLPNGRQ